MSSDPNKKSARTFQCRDVLWDTFEQMARELECSVDYLINEAMKQYARQRRAPGAQQGREAPPPSGDPRMYGGGASAGGGAMPMPAPPQARPPSLGPPPGRVPPPPARGPSGPLPVPPPPMHRGSPSAIPAPPPRAMSSQGISAPPTGSRPAPPPPRTVPPPIPRGATPVPPPPAQNGFPAPAHGATLSIIYQGEKLPITKDRFVIGRGKQSSDLTLKDPNVSRQHAMIEFQNGVYFMVDMGSTNGVEYNGQRIARKQISEGDVFKICDHDLVFTYR
jgi:neural Wiskott-Aldrich syndrome protein